MALRDLFSAGYWTRRISKTELTTEPPPPSSPNPPGMDSGGVVPFYQDQKVSAFAELGITGLRRHGGYVYEEILRELTGYRAIRIYKEMSENEPIIGALLFAIEMLVRGVSWEVKPAGKENEYLVAANRVRENMDDMSHSWTDFIVEVLSMLPYGFSWHEVVYKIRNGPSDDPEVPASRFDDGTIGWRKIPIRSQDSLLRWEFDKSGGVQAMLQIAPPDYKTRNIPIEKSLLFRTKAHKNNPQGASILRAAYIPWYYKKNIQRIEAIGVERDLAGMPSLGVPPRLLSADASPEDRALFLAYQKMITNVRRDESEGVIYPLSYDQDGHELYKFSLMSTGGRRQFDTSPIIQRYSQEMAVTSLADFILIGHGSQGSSGGKGGTALIENKTQIFSDALGSWLDMIASTINRYEIPRLFKLNGWKADKLPELIHGKVEQVNLEALGGFLGNLAKAGMPLFPDNMLENEIRRRSGLPEKPEEEDDDAGFTEDIDIDRPEVQKPVAAVPPPGKANGSAGPQKPAPMAQPAPPASPNSARRQ